MLELECRFTLSSPLQALPLLSQAAVALSSTALRPVPQLPTELLAIIIAHAQNTSPQSDPPDFRARQRTNVSLSLVSRQFHRLVRPRLQSEIHLFREEQLVALDTMRRKNPERSKGVQLFTMDLHLTRLRYRPDDIWYGYLLPPVLDWLGATKQIHLTIEGIDMNLATVHIQLERLFGQNWDLPGFFELRKGVEEGHLNLPSGTRYAEACAYHAVVTPGPQLRRLYVVTKPGMCEMTALLQAEFDEEVEFDRHPWE